MTGLTDKQRAIRDFLLKFAEEHGYPPTLREIGKAFGIKSTNGVNDHLRCLERKGFITRDTMKSRSIQVLEDHDPGFKVNVGALLDGQEKTVKELTDVVMELSDIEKRMGIDRLRLMQIAQRAEATLRRIQRAATTDVAESESA